MPSSGRVFYFLSTCDSVREARREVADQLREWGCDEDVVARMVLCVSEFASNSIQHARSSQGYLVLCFLDDGFLTVGVLDFDERSLPCRTESSPENLTGRGLMIVEGVADGWGVTPFKGGKMVFAQAKVGPGDLTPAGRCPPAGQGWLARSGGHRGSGGLRRSGRLIWPGFPGRFGGTTQACQRTTQSTGRTRSARGETDGVGPVSGRRDLPVKPRSVRRGLRTAGLAAGVSGGARGEAEGVGPVSGRRDLR
jgi:anti-sigma regulatory factor (Ser/Thr protein kinase)